ncbi:TonB-dependent receptor [Sphingomonas oligophenolica]|uniref:TonB-dependent receptor n=1 Tax=Sphingomonas oligophenolica TaxID=301154 RepID=A0ABU9Y6M0_9SPHN
MRAALAALFISSALAEPAAAHGQRTSIDLPEGTLATTLPALARQAGITIGMAGRLPAVRTPAIHARIDVATALRRLLRDSGYRAVQVDPVTWRIEPAPHARARPATRAAEPGAIETPDIIVTASKRGERLSDLPLSISLLPGDVAGQPAIRRGLSDLLTRTESVSSTNLGPGRDRLFLRGVSDSPFNGPTQATVSLFLDNARISYASPDPDLKLVDIDHVEVLRGPQGTLYGAGALGGIVRIVTAQPDLARWSGSAATEISTVAHGGQGYSIEGTVNAPIVTGRLALRASAWSETMPGWIDDTERNLRDVNRSRRRGARAALAWRVSDDWTITLSGVGQGLDTRDSQYATSGLTRATALAEPVDNDFAAVTADIRGAIAGLDVQSTSSFVRHEFDDRYDASVLAATLGLAAPLAAQERHRLVMKGQEVRISDPAASHPWVVGLSLLDAGTSTGIGFEPAGAPAIPIRSRLDETFEAALYAEGTQRLSPALDFKLGLRGFVSTSHHELDSTSEPLATKAGLTPSASLVWHAGPHALLWLRYASAIRPGGLVADSGPTSPAIHSDELKSIELGWRLTALDGDLQFHGAIFGYLWNHVQSDRLLDLGLIAAANVGDAANLGLEFGGRVGGERLHLDLGVTAQHARLSAPEAVLGGLDDRRLPVVPDLAGHAQLAGTIMVARHQVSPYAALRYTGAMRLSFDPALDRRAGDYVTADAGIAIAFGRQRLSIDVTNLFDGHADSFGFGNPFTLALVGQHTPERPRAISVRMGTRF